MPGGEAALQLGGGAALESNCRNSACHRIIPMIIGRARQSPSLSRFPACDASRQPSAMPMLALLPHAHSGRRGCAATRSTSILVGLLRSDRLGARRATFGEFAVCRLATLGHRLGHGRRAFDELALGVLARRGECRRRQHRKRARSDQQSPDQVPVLPTAGGSAVPSCWQPCPIAMMKFLSGHRWQPPVPRCPVLLRRYME